jgi:hypothetical protein
MRTVLFIAASIISSVAFGQGPQISWDKSSYDFGEIRQGEKVEYTFKFHNIGDEPLMITNVTTQCGCTAPKGWPRDPIQPGNRGEITLVFDSTGKFGRVNKVATVMSNAVNKEGTQVLLSGNILEKKLTNP